MQRPAQPSQRVSSSGGRGAGGNGPKRVSSLVQRVLADARTRQLQVATSGQYKYMIVGKIVKFLKTAFLEIREQRPTLAQLLEKVDEGAVSEELIEWLKKEALPEHPRIRVVETRRGEGVTRYAYEPPLKNCSSVDELLELLKKRHEEEDGGLLRSLVEDSYPGADRAIKTLASEGKIIVVERLDKDETLFYKAPEPELDKCVADSLFVDLWRKVNVANKDMSHIKAHLKKKGLPVFDEEKYRSKVLNQEKRKRVTKNAGPKSKRPRKSRTTNVIKTNVHLGSVLIEYDNSDKAKEIPEIIQL